MIAVIKSFWRSTPSSVVPGALPVVAVMLVAQQRVERAVFALDALPGPALHGRRHGGAHVHADDAPEELLAQTDRARACGRRHILGRCGRTEGGAQAGDHGLFQDGAAIDPMA